MTNDSVTQLTLPHHSVSFSEYRYWLSGQIEKSREAFLEESRKLSAGCGSVSKQSDAYSAYVLNVHMDDLLNAFLITLTNETKGA